MENVLHDARSIQRRPTFSLWYLLPLVLAVVLMGYLYQTTFDWWWHEWTAPGSFYAHAVFVPFFVAVMIYRNRTRIAALPWKPSWTGLLLVLPALSMVLLAARSEVVALKSLSFVLLMLGLVLLIFGNAITRQLLFPLVFILMMIPIIPDQLINSIAFPIQLASARFATMMLNLCSLHSVQQGTLIQMDSYKMAVELPCSGFKTLVSLITFSAAFSYLVEAAPWKRWTLFLLTPPLSLFINALRIFFIGVVGELISTKAAQTFHDWSGFIVLVIAFTILFNAARLLNCDRFLGIPLNAVEEERDRLAAAAIKQGGAPPPPPWWHEVLSWRITPMRLKSTLPYAVALNLLLLMTLGMQGKVIKQTVALPPIGTQQVPTTFSADGMTFKADTNPILKDYDKLTPDVQAALNPTRVINRDYQSNKGAMVQFFMTAGNGRKVFHDPHTCSLGSDAMLNDVGVIDIPTDHGVLRVQHSRYKRTGQKEETEMMFFYVVEGHTLQRTEQIRNKMILQTVLGDSGQPSYFFRLVQHATGTEPQRREELIAFIKGMWNSIGPILTGQQAAISEPPPVPVEQPEGH